MILACKNTESAVQFQLRLGIIYAIYYICRIHAEHASETKTHHDINHNAAPFVCRSRGLSCPAMEEKGEKGRKG